MALPINFREAAISEIALAKVGNPLKGEPLLTSKNLCRFEEDEAESVISIDSGSELLEESQSYSPSFWRRRKNAFKIFGAFFSGHLIFKNCLLC